MIPQIHILLHNIRSTHNVGAILRTADAVGVTKVYFSGYTPAPIDRFGRQRKDISKASLGAEKSVEWESVNSSIDLINKLKKQKFTILSLEQDVRSVDYRKFRSEDNILLIVGNEVDGVDKNILDLSDEIIEIPMLGKKESLNVSVATGIVLYAIQKLP
jgi:tRNA G18 (ribose-2'-O)-methylase SpoU